MAVFIGKEVISRCRSIENTKTVRDNVLEVIDNAIRREWSYEEFVLSASYKPAKHNVPVNTFVSEMRARGLKLPEPGERFQYVIVKRDAHMYYTSYGTKNDLKKGYRMEYLWYAEENKLKIDLSHYFINSVVGICARFINFDPIYKKLTAESNGDDADDANTAVDEADIAEMDGADIVNDEDVDSDDDDVDVQKAAKKDLIAYVKRAIDDNPEELLKLKKDIKEVYENKKALAEHLYCSRLPPHITKIIFKTGKKDKHYKEIAKASDFGNISELASDDWAAENEELIIDICKKISEHL
jgi:hypothetical protein